MSISTWFYTNFRNQDFSKYQSCGGWTKLGAVDRFLGNEELHHILYAMPELFDVFRMAIMTDYKLEYDRDNVESELIRRLYYLVGWHSSIPELQNSKSYDLVYCSLRDLLAPDVNDLLTQAAQEDKEFYEADGPTDFGSKWDKLWADAQSDISSGSPIFQQQLRESGIEVDDLGDGFYSIRVNFRED